MKGRVFEIRLADDFAIDCELEEDAHRVMDVLPKRFERYGLTIHLQKTGLIHFRKPDKKDGSGLLGLGRTSQLHNDRHDELSIHSTRVPITLWPNH